jgi:hypothetical protein
LISAGGTDWYRYRSGPVTPVPTVFEPVAVRIFNLALSVVFSVFSPF